MSDVYQKSVILRTQDEALEHINTVIRHSWEVDWPQLGAASILETSSVEGHTAWSYFIEGMPVSRDNRTHWLLDTGDTLNTTLQDGESTLSSAFSQRFH